MDEQARFDPGDIDDGSVKLDEPVEQMSLKDSFGTAVGAAMLGFEQALRGGPPPETVAAEDVPERGIADDGHSLIEFAESIERSRADE
jgi:hypothetical protein